MEKLRRFEPSAELMKRVALILMVCSTHALAHEPRWKALDESATPDLQITGNQFSVKLAVGSAMLDVRRAWPKVVENGFNPDDPTLVVDKDGEVHVAWVGRRGRNRERVFLRTAYGPRRPLGQLRPVTPGPRSWRPRLVTSSDALWLVWCGRHEEPRRVDIRRQIFARQILPKQLGPIIEVSQRMVMGDDGRHCDPDAAVSRDGRLHVVWEASSTIRPMTTRLAYRVIQPTAPPDLGAAPVFISEGPFDRRPAIAIMPDGTPAVAFDRLVSTGPEQGALDPDYDVLVTFVGNQSSPFVVDAGAGIQSAPDLAIDEDRLLIAYHSSANHPMVKWWQVRRLSRDGAVERLVPPDGAERRVPAGEQQGAELPQLLKLPDGRLVIATRASQGAYLHVADGSGTTPPLDLTRRGWGARGVRMEMRLARDASILLARRARHEVLIEHLVLRDAAMVQPVRFETVEVAPKPPSSPPPRSERFAYAMDIFYGDVHMHSAMSDGTGPPDEILARAWVRGFDFACLTDHDQVAGARMTLSEHDEMVWLTEFFDSQTDFSAIHAFEWTTPPVPKGYGHRNVYFRGFAPTPLPGSADGVSTTRRLMQVLKGERVLVAPHHTAWAGTDWVVDERIQRQFEIVSVHGVFEDWLHQPLPPRGSRKNMFATNGLKLGVKYGFFGGSDAHGLLWHHGVGRRKDPWGHGLTGVIALVNTREAIWDGMFARRTFATSGPFMKALLSAGLAVQGEEISHVGAPRLTWWVAGTQGLTEVALVRDGRVIHQQRLDGVTPHQGDFTDSEVKPRRQPYSYYVRAIQGSGLGGTDVVWSSPIFIRVK